MSDDDSKSDPKHQPSTCVRFNERDWNRVERMKQVTGLSIPELLRRALLNRFDLETPKFSPEDTRSIVATLNRIGNNINQIARVLNSGLRSGWHLEFNETSKQLSEIRHFMSVKCGCHKNKLG